jgi:DNA-directed RNA polymerase subunit RPC12/RpoP
MSQIKEQKYRCLECGKYFNDSNSLKGEVLTCSDCGLEHEVKEENGIKYLVVLEIEGEDWG